MRARRAPRTPRDPAAEEERIRSRTVEQWVDEGSVRAEAEAATRRAAAAPSRPRSAAAPVDPEVAVEINAAVGEQRGQRLIERLSSASLALERERYDDARQLVAPVLREMPDLAAAHEVAGLAAYRLGRWKQAARELEAARSLRPAVELLPVLADTYRALRRWDDVERVWLQIRQASPAHEVMAEGRIVAAGALADRGEIKAAIRLMESAQQVPKRVREHHLRQWYALADLYDRAGDTVAASRWFREVARHDPGFVDVTDRLRSLGR